MRERELPRPFMRSTRVPMIINSPLIPQLTVSVIIVRLSGDYYGTLLADRSQNGMNSSPASA